MMELWHQRKVSIMSRNSFFVRMTTMNLKLLRVSSNFIGNEDEKACDTWKTWCGWHFNPFSFVSSTVVKQRLQMYNSPFRSMTECAIKVYRSEGLSAFYRSYGTQLAMNVPFQCVHFIVYEAMQNATNPERTYNPMGHVVSGGVSGLFHTSKAQKIDGKLSFFLIFRSSSSSPNHSAWRLQNSAEYSGDTLSPFVTVVISFLMWCLNFCLIH